MVLRVGHTQQLTATLRDAAGNALTGRPVSWTSSDPGVATVSTSGLVSALAPGNARISATSEGRSAAASVVVTLVPAASVDVTPAAATRFVGTTITLVATVSDSAGNPLANRQVDWVSETPSVATVGSEGVVTAIGVGSARITATVEGKKGSAEIEVVPLRVARVVVSPEAVTLRPWQTVALTATAYDSVGTVLPNRVITWRSSDSIRVHVNTSGVVTGNLLGTVMITATSEGRADTATVVVTTPSPVWVGENIDVASGSETSVAINPINPLNVVVSSNFVHNYSLDGGRTWTSTYWQGIAPAAEADPNVSFDHQGTLYRQGLSLFTDPRHLYVDVSTNGGVTLTRRAAYRPPSPSDGNPDQGILAIDTVAASPYRGSLYVLFSDYPTSPSPACQGFCLRVIVSRDGGATWSRPVDVSDETQFIQEHSSYVAIGPNGEVYAAWWSGGGTRIMFARSHDGGLTWSRNVFVRRAVFYQALPHPISDDVRGNVTIDVDRSTGPFRGRIYISGTDVNGPFGGAADSWIVHSSDGGMTWSTASLLSDGPRGAFRYYFQPRISVSPNGRVDATWYDTRDNTSSDINAITYDVYYAFSQDGGNRFGKSIRLSSAPSIKRTPCSGNTACGHRVLYEYLGLVSDDTRSIAAWADHRTGTARVVIAVVWHSP